MMQLPTTEITRHARQRLTISQCFEPDDTRPRAVLEFAPHVGQSERSRIELTTVEEVRRLHNWLGSHLLYLGPPRKM